RIFCFTLESVSGQQVMRDEEKENRYCMRLNLKCCHKGVVSENESMVTPVFATPILTTSWLA
ncbi:hypothetical protein ACV8SN_25725, partial [Citrobacter portucalensis]